MYITLLVLGMIYKLHVDGKKIVFPHSPRRRGPRRASFIFDGRAFLAHLEPLSSYHMLNKVY